MAGRENGISTVGRMGQGLEPPRHAHVAGGGMTVNWRRKIATYLTAAVGGAGQDA